MASLVNPSTEGVVSPAMPATASNATANRRSLRAKGILRIGAMFSFIALSILFQTVQRSKFRR